MTTPSPKPTSTDSIHTQRALATVEAFLQASNHPKHTKNAWLYLKNLLQKLNITQSTHPTSAQEEILKELSSIKKSISTLSRPLL